TKAEPEEASGSEELNLLETNLDDVSPEVMGYLMDRVFERGALDCWFTAIQMKKNRPATMVSVLCRPALKDALIGILVTETPTLGVRVTTVSRLCLAREVSEVTTKWGPVPVKVSKYNDKITNAKAEHDVMKEIARSEGIPLRDVEAEIMLCIERLKNGRM
ncbi:MAG: nickel insertion protein, partial [Acidobacteriota bacterium]